MGLLDGKAALVTGSGRGIGRGIAIALAKAGAKVIVNDLGATLDGEGEEKTPADQVVDEILTNGGMAVTNYGSVSDWDQAHAMVDQVVEAFGRIDILVNVAGILRDRMIFNMTEAEWDAVVAVHLKGHFCATRHATAHWRERSKAGEAVDGRIINTASPSGLYGNAGQTNYGAAKAGIAAMTLVEALEMARYGVTANCLAPTAVTRLVAPVMGGEENIPEATKEALAPRWVAVVATWLASPAARAVTGRVFDVRGDRLVVAEGWHRGPEATNPGTPEGVGAVITDLLAEARPNGDLDGKDDASRFTVG